MLEGSLVDLPSTYPRQELSLRISCVRGRWVTEGTHHGEALEVELGALKVSRPGDFNNRP